MGITRSYWEATRKLLEATRKLLEATRKLLRPEVLLQALTGWRDHSALSLEARPMFRWS